MKKTRIWFNRWFSVAYHYMNSIKNNADGMAFEIYGTHADLNHMSLQACDYSEQEPKIKGEQYVIYCLDFCQRHQIDVFIPHIEMLEIAQNIERFEQIGTKVIVCGDIDLLQKLMVKDLFYESIRGTGIVAIPAYYVVTNAEQFKQAHDKLIAQNHKVCIKPTDAEGGRGFRIVKDNRNRLTELFDTINHYVSSEEVYNILSETNECKPLMVMELLEDDEYSIDCLAKTDGELLAAVPRRKAGGRVRHMESRPELLQLAADVARHYKIPYNYNIQVKYHAGVPKLLEINPRMSGGLHVTCLTGINFPYLAVRLALGLEVTVPQAQYDLYASYVENPMLLNRQETSSSVKL